MEANDLKTYLPIVGCFRVTGNLIRTLIRSMIRCFQWMTLLSCSVAWFRCQHISQGQRWVRVQYTSSVYCRFLQLLWASTGCLFHRWDQRPMFSLCSSFRRILGTLKCDARALFLCSFEDLVACLKDHCDKILIGGWRYSRQPAGTNYGHLRWRIFWYNILSLFGIWWFLSRLFSYQRWKLTLQSSQIVVYYWRSLYTTSE